MTSSRRPTHRVRLRDRGPGPLWRRALGSGRRRPVWFGVIVVAVGFATVARSTPTLIVDASADRAFAAEIDALPDRVPRNQRLELRAYATGVPDAATLDRISEVIDGVPVYAAPITSVRPVGYRTDRDHPTPVVRLASDPDRATTAVLFARTSALLSLQPAAGSAASAGDEGAAGVWLPDTVATAIGAEVGDAIELELVYSTPPEEPLIASSVVAGIYATTDGLPSPAGAGASAGADAAPDVDWPAITDDLPDDPAAPGRPAPLLIGSAPTVLDLAAAMGETTLSTWDGAWDGQRTIEQGRAAAKSVSSIARRFRDRSDALGSITDDLGIDPVQVVSGIEGLVARADETAAQLRPIIESTARATQLVAIGLVVVAAWLHIRRRQGELALMIGQGMRTSAIGALATVELLPAAIVGVALGWWGGRALGDGLDEGASIAQQAIAEANRAAWTTGPIVLAGIFLASTTAAWSVEPARAGWSRHLAAALRWEVLVTVVAIASGAQLATQDGPALTSGAALVFPIAGILAGAGLGARLLALVAGRLASRRSTSRRGTTRPPRRMGWWLARHRVVHALADTSALVVVAAAGAGLLVYAGSFATSGTSGTDDKVAALAGARSTLSIPWSGALTDGREGMPTDLPEGWSVVWRDSDVSAAPSLVVDLLAVDPATFVGTAAWRDAFADASLPDLLADMQLQRRGRVGIVAAGPRADWLPDRGTLSIGAWTAPYEVIRRIASAPGQRELVSLAMADAASLFALIPSEDPTTKETQRIDDPDGWFRTELWSSETPAGLTASLAARGIDLGASDATIGGISVEERDAAIVAFRSAIPYLRSIGIVAVLLACASLAQHAVRRRSAAAVETAMLMQMGVAPATLRWSAMGELVLVGLVGAAAGAGLGAAMTRFMIGRLDPLPRSQPEFTPLLSWWSVAIAVAVIAGVAAIVALLAARDARRAEVGEVLRVSG